MQMLQKNCTAVSLICHWINCWKWSTLQEKNGQPTTIWSPKLTEIQMNGMSVKFQESTCPPISGSSNGHWIQRNWGYWSETIWRQTHTPLHRPMHNTIICVPYSKQETFDHFLSFLRIISTDLQQNSCPRMVASLPTLCKRLTSQLEPHQPNQPGVM